MFGDGKLLIIFIMHIFKWLQCYSIYWAIEDARAVEWVLRQPMEYYHVTRDTKCVIDDMARQTLEAQATITFWDGQVPKDALGN